MKILAKNHLKHKVTIALVTALLLTFLAFTGHAVPNSQIGPPLADGKPTVKTQIGPPVVGEKPTLKTQIGPPIAGSNPAVKTQIKTTMPTTSPIKRP
ncbi:MAG: hypothetical protein P1U34_06125 [Coxiellaceae bacterium]|nr:hypothetical protein [Coxiellaceae bacterium]